MNARKKGPASSEAVEVLDHKNRRPGVDSVLESQWQKAGILGLKNARNGLLSSAESWGMNCVLFREEKQS